jgi:Flp pilus assembly protein TadG
MVKKLWLERVNKHIRSSQGMITVELALGLSALTFILIAIIYSFSIFLAQLNLIETAHNIARQAARGQEFSVPTNVNISQQYQAGTLQILVTRQVDFFVRSIEISATAEVVVE